MISYTAFGDEKVKKLLFFLSIFSFFLLITFACSTIIKVNVKKELKGNISSFSFDSFLDILSFQTEFYNTGSVAYKTRIRMDLLNGSQPIFTGWSDERVLMPGDRKKFEVFSFVDSTGNFTARLRVYFADEILEKNFEVNKNETVALREDVFELKDLRTYDDFIIFDLKSKKRVKDVVILPHNFPLGWIFEQKKLNLIGENEEKIIVLKYKPSVFSVENLTLIIVANGGSFYSEKEIELKKESGIVWLIHLIIDKFRLLKAI